MYVYYFGNRSNIMVYIWFANTLIFSNYYKYLYISDGSIYFIQGYDNTSFIDLNTSLQTAGSINCPEPNI